MCSLTHCTVTFVFWAGGIRKDGIDGEWDYQQLRYATASHITILLSGDATVPPLLRVQRLLPLHAGLPPRLAAIPHLHHGHGEGEAGEQLVRDACSGAGEGGALYG